MHEGAGIDSGPSCFSRRHFCIHSEGAGAFMPLKRISNGVGFKEPLNKGCFEGHGLQPLHNPRKIDGALQAAENSRKAMVLKGHDFSRAAKPAKSVWALAPEGVRCDDRHLVRISLAAGLAFDLPAIHLLLRPINRLPIGLERKRLRRQRRVELEVRVMTDP